MLYARDVSWNISRHTSAINLAIVVESVDIASRVIFQF